jgi:hypothetical protein
MIEDAEKKGLITPGKVISQVRYIDFGIIQISRRFQLRECGN